MPDTNSDYLQLAANDDERELLLGQLAQARALRNPGPRRGGYGAAFQGLADTINAISSYRDEDAITGRLAALRGLGVVRAAQQAQGADQQAAIAAEQLQKTRDANAAMASPVARRVLSRTLGTFMPELAKDPDVANAPAPTLEHLLGPAERYASAKEAARAREAAMHLMATGGGTVTLTGPALDQAAAAYAATRQLPALGRYGGPAHAAIVNRAAELYPGANLAGNAATYKADAGSLAALQKQADAVDAFEHTAGKNLDQFLSASQRVVDSGSPLINRALRSFDARVLGKPEMVAFNTARQVAVTEIAKVLSNPGLSGVLSDSARHEVQELIGPDATLAQIHRAAQILRSDMANRQAAMDAQIGAVRSRLHAGGGEAPPSSTTSQGGPVHIGSAEDYARLPSGALYLAPGETQPRRKR